MSVIATMERALPQRGLSADSTWYRCSYVHQPKRLDGRLSQSGLTRAASILIVAVIFAFAVPAFRCVAQPLSNQNAPTIRISSPFAAPLWRADVDAGERFAVVSNAGQAVTIWPLGDVNRPLTARLPIQNEQRKRAHAVAISANSELVAYSAPPTLDSNGRLIPQSATIYILRRSTGRIVTRITGAANNIASRPQSLKFSPDGQHLAAVLSSGCGVRLWTTRDWKLVFKDDDGYASEPNPDKCCPTGTAECDALSDTTGLVFLKPINNQPYLVTSGDSGVRVYDKVGDTIKLRAAATPASLDLERPAGVTASHDGTQLVIGDRRDKQRAQPLRLRLAIVDSATLKPTRVPFEIRAQALLTESFLQGGPNNTDLVQSSLDRVALLKTVSDEYVFGAGAFPCEIVRPELRVQNGHPISGGMCIARWSLSQQDAAPRFVPIGTERIIDLVALPRRQGLLIASQKRIGIVDIDGATLQDVGSKLLEVVNSAIDLRDGDLRFRISADGRTVEMEDYRVRAGGSGLVTFDLASLSVRATDSSGVARLDPDHGLGPQPAIVTNWRNVQGRSPLIMGSELHPSEVQRDEVFRAIAVNRELKRVAIASSEFLRLVSYEAGEPRVMCKQAIAEDAYRINITQDGSLIVSGHSDGTIRWHRIHPREGGCQFELLASVYLAEMKSGNWTWAAWRPSGVYSRDLDSDLKLEWQRTDKNGQIQITPFERLILNIDRDAVRKAADPIAQPLSSKEVLSALAPDEDIIEAEQASDAIVELLGEPGDRNVSTERVALRLSIGDSRGWPKRLAVKLGDESPVEKIYGNLRVAPQDAIEINKDDLVDGQLRIDVQLPAKVRSQQGADFHLCFFIDDHPDACHRMRWVGKIAPALPRRLWALLVGISKAAEGSGLDLDFPQNDAIDLARLFTSDFERRTANAIRNLPPDFARVQIDLAVSASSSTKDELDDLSRRTFVTFHQATKAGIAFALQKIAQAIADANRVEAGDDLFLMLFSGHGIVDPHSQSGSAFLTADSTRDLSRESLSVTSLKSSELLHLLRQISARKIIIFDACRSLSSLPAARPFSPERIRSEFERQVLDAHFFFSSDAGQESFELAQIAFDKTRPAARQGNGLFTFALLQALTSPRIPADNMAMARRIDIPWVAEYLRARFFNRHLPESTANKLRAQFPTALPYVPEPKYVPARTDSTDQLIRTIELTEPRPQPRRSSPK